MTEEHWVPVSGFPGYSVNPLGQVKKDDTGRILQVRLNQYGVPYVGMMRGWKQCSRVLPRLVLNAFKPQPNNIWDTPIHLDGDRTNCHVDNLEWRPHAHAVRYNRQFHEPYAHPIAVPVKDLETDEKFPNSLSAACKHGILEQEVVISILHNTPTWPIHRRFAIVD